MLQIIYTSYLSKKFGCYFIKTHLIKTTYQYNLRAFYLMVFVVNIKETTVNAYSFSFSSMCDEIINGHFNFLPILQPL